MGNCPRPACRIAAIPFAIPLAILLLAFVAPAPLRSDGFAAPHYAAAPFSGDGVFLDAAERRRLLDALAALATGFRDLAAIDGDLRAKSLAAALALDPMDFTVRAAYRALAADEPGPEIAGLDSLSSVSESLWIVSQKLLAPPTEPDAALLAPYLMELSLTIHPAPPRERLAAYSQAAGGAAPDWSDFAALSGDGASAHRAAELVAQAELAANPAAEPPAVAEPDPFAAGKGSGKGSGKARMLDAEERQARRRMQAEEEETPDFEDPVTLALPAVLHLPGNEAVAGEFSLTVRGPESFAEARAFEFLETVPAEEYPTLPVIPQEGDAAALGALEVPGSYPATRGWAWPEGLIALASFRGTESPASSREADGSLALLVLLEAVFTGREPNRDFLVAGAVAHRPEGGGLRLRSNAVLAARAASDSGHRYLLLPGGTVESPLEQLLADGGAELLLQPEWIMARGGDDLFRLALEETPPALVEASESFSEIVAAAGRQPFDELIVHPRTREKLEEVLALFPGHFSARVLLAYAERKADAEAP